ncbi:hypothetical protein ACFV2H_14000 [Streptomyces sp. NPDC059629]|uniref:hypothetical protein n=1 Tax=Streptomyces sp. NPDC059629 TaxID=3346889 RepID=UPI00369E7ECF
MDDVGDESGVRIGGDLAARARPSEDAARCRGAVTPAAVGCAVERIVSPSAPGLAPVEVNAVSSGAVDADC